MFLGSRWLKSVGSYREVSSFLSNPNKISMTDLVSLSGCDIPWLLCQVPSCAVSLQGRLEESRLCSSCCKAQWWEMLLAKYSSALCWLLKKRCKLSKFPLKHKQGVLSSCKDFSLLHTSSCKISSFSKVHANLSQVPQWSGIIWRCPWDFNADICFESFSLPFFSSL